MTQAPGFQHPQVLARWAAALGFLVLSSCANLQDYYEPIDMQGSPVDLTGTWYFPQGGGLPFLQIVQNGTHAKVALKPTYGGPPHELGGDVQGRVLLADSAEMQCAITATPDRLRARVGWAGGWWSGRESQALRLDLGKSGDRDATKGDALLSGGLLCQMPGNAGATREVAVFLEYHSPTGVEVIPQRTCVSLESPPQVWKVPYPGDGLFGYLLDRGSLLAARASSAVQRKEPVTVEGKSGWVILSPAWTEKGADLRPARLLAEYYEKDPDSGALPKEVVEVAVRAPGGEWRSTPHYLYCAATLTQARAVYEGGRPVRAELVQPEQPALEEFLVLEESLIARARWRNQGLLEVKTRTLPKLLRDLKTAELSNLSIRLEKFVLDLNHESENLRDRVQKSIEGSTLSAGEIRDDTREIAQVRSQLADPNLEENTAEQLKARIRQLEINVARLQQERIQSQAGVDHMRELSTVYRERVEILKPFLSAIKEEIGNRGK